MSALWSLFKMAVYKAADERSQEMRRTRALESIAQSLDTLAERGMLEGEAPYYTPPPKGK